MRVFKSFFFICQSHQMKSWWVVGLSIAEVCCNVTISIREIWHTCVSLPLPSHQSHLFSPVFKPKLCCQIAWVSCCTSQGFFGPTSCGWPCLFLTSLFLLSPSKAPCFTLDLIGLLLTWVTVCLVFWPRISCKNAFLTCGIIIVCKDPRVLTFCGSCASFILCMNCFLYLIKFQLPFKLWCAWATMLYWDRFVVYNPLDNVKVASLCLTTERKKSCVGSEMKQILKLLTKSDALPTKKSPFAPSCCLKTIWLWIVWSSWRKRRKT